MLRSLPGGFPELAVTDYLIGSFDYRLASGRGQSRLDCVIADDGPCQPMRDQNWSRCYRCALLSWLVAGRALLEDVPGV